MSDIFESFTGRATKNLCTSPTHEEHSKPASSANKLCGKARHGKTYCSLCCSAKRRGSESPDQPGWDST